MNSVDLAFRDLHKTGYVSRKTFNKLLISMGILRDGLTGIMGEIDDDKDPFRARSLNSTITKRARKALKKAYEDIA